MRYNFSIFACCVKMTVIEVQQVREDSFMPTLEWIGKDKVVNHHLEVPYRVLEEQYTYNADQSENMIIRGDNLEALKAPLPQYEGKVKCVYIDPPYNTGNEGWVYDDNVNDPRIKKRILVLVEPINLSSL